MPSFPMLGIIPQGPSHRQHPILGGTGLTTGLASLPQPSRMIHIDQVVTWEDYRKQRTVEPQTTRVLRARNGTGITTQHSQRVLRQVSKVTSTVLLRLSSGVMVILRTLQIPQTDHYETSWHNDLSGFAIPTGTSLL